MSNNLQAATLFLTAVLLVPGTSEMAQAKPSMSLGLHCAACHNEAFPDVLTVNGDAVVGGKETFDVLPGDTAKLSFTVTEEEGFFDEWEYMLGVSGLELTGLTPDLGSDWEHRPTDFVSYVLDDDYEDNRTFTLDVAVDSSMAPGVYPLGAVVAGEGDLSTSGSEVKWSASAPFSLRVIPEPSTLVLVLALAASSILAVRGRRKE
ncbi:MAG: PEP-CTERM sorting domain-containing protein [Pirellulales bacterium]